MRPLSILFTNNALAQRGGSETYVRDVALALLHRGHRPAVFSLVHGDVAGELRRATIPVLDDVTRLGEAPDVIHGHHHLETLIAALAFPDTPVVNFCHGWVPWEEMPLHHPAVRRYVAVDEVCVDRLVREEGVAPGDVELLLNFVDLERFRPRPPLPGRPARALVISNAATTGGYARVIASACEAAGIHTDIVGASAGNAASAPETLLTAYDVVFAKGRTALEALAVGCATVLSDAAGAGPLVTPDNYQVLRARNFGIRELRQRHDDAWYAGQIASYDPARAAEVSHRVRAEAGLDQAIGRLLDIYAAAMHAPPKPGDGSRAAARHCSRIALPLKQAHGLADRVPLLAGELDGVRAELEVQTAAAAGLARTVKQQQSHLDSLQAEVSRRQQECHRLERERTTAAGVLQARVDALVADAALRQQRAGEAACRHTEVALALQGRIDALLAEAARREEDRRAAELTRTAATRVAHARVDALHSRVDQLLAEARSRDQEMCDADGQLGAAREQIGALRREVAAFAALPSLRLRDAILRAPLLGPLLQSGARRLSRRLGQPQLEPHRNAAGAT